MSESSRRVGTVGAIFAVGVCAVALAAGGSAPWGYHGDIGPAHWGRLDPSFALCGEGLQQTPIDLAAGASVPGGPSLAFGYGRNDIDVVNNGHTVQANPAGPARSIVRGGIRYDLVQFHWHTPSEHTVRGADYPLELHLVHRSSEGRLAVVGVFAKKGRAHRELNRIFGSLPQREGEHRPVPSFDISTLLPAGEDDDREYFTYPGSLTTPPCSEGVEWTVLREPLEMSSDQIQSFVHLFSGHDFPDGNRRPVQPLHGRTVHLRED